MGKFLGLFAAVVCLGFLSACNTKPATPDAPVNPVVSIGCSAEMAATSAMAATVVSSLNCTNLQAIQGDIMQVLGKANLCATAAPAPASLQSKPAMKGVVGNIVCPLALDAAMGLVTSKIPVTWGCDPKSTTAGLQATLAAACSKAIGI